MTETEEQEAANQMRREVLGCTCGKPKVRMIVRGNRYEIQACIRQTSRWPWGKPKWGWVTSMSSTEQDVIRSWWPDACEHGANKGYLVTEESTAPK